MAERMTETGGAQPRAGRGRLALVTGGAGFIGSHIVQGLIEQDWRVRVLDDFSTGTEANLFAACGGAWDGAIECLRADVGDPAALESAAEGAEVVFHEAAIASVPRSIDEPHRAHAVNLGGTLAVLEAARLKGCRRVVFASSSAVYGQAGGERGVSEADPTGPVSPYAAQKLASEHYLAVYADLYGLETVALRYFNVYGPRQDPHSDYAAVIPLFAQAALAGQALCVHGDGEQTRDFIHVSDVARVNLLAADAPVPAGCRLNVASGLGTRIIDLVSVLESVLGRAPEVVHGAPRAGDVRRSVAETAALREILDFVPVIDLQTGIRRTIEALAESEASRGASQ